MTAVQAVIVRPEQAGDENAIRELVEAAFAASEHGHNGEAGIVDALRDADALELSLVACQGEEPVAHVAVSAVRVSDGASGWFGLGPIAVRPQLQGRGIGSQLMRAAIDALCARDARGCVLVGDPGYYGRFGFQSVSGLHYPGVPPEYLLALVFRGAKPSGSVAYHGAFSAAG